MDGSDQGVQVFTPLYPLNWTMVEFSVYTRSVGVAVVLANLKDNIDKCRFEAHHMLKVLKNTVVIENLILFLTHIRKFCVYGSLRL